MNKNEVLWIVVCIIAVMAIVIASCTPPPSVTVGDAMDIEVAYVDCKYGVVCWGSYTYYSGGMSCLPIKETRISYEDVCP